MSLSGGHVLGSLPLASEIVINSLDLHHGRLLSLPAELIVISAKALPVAASGPGRCCHRAPPAPHPGTRRGSPRPISPLWVQNQTWWVRKIQSSLSFPFHFKETITYQRFSTLKLDKATIPMPCEGPQADGGAQSGLLWQLSGRSQARRRMGMLLNW